MVPEITAAKSLAILSSFPQSIEDLKQDRSRRKILTNQTLGVILMELHKTIDVGEEGFSFYQIHIIFP
jgi:hypothetical protein